MGREGHGTYATGAKLGGSPRLPFGVDDIIIDGIRFKQDTQASRPPCQFHSSQACPITFVLSSDPLGEELPFSFLLRIYLLNGVRLDRATVNTHARLRWGPEKHPDRSQIAALVPHPRKLIIQQRIWAGSRCVQCSRAHRDLRVHTRATRQSSENPHWGTNPRHSFSSPSESIPRTREPARNAAHEMR